MPKPLHLLVRLGLRPRHLIGPVLLSVVVGIAETGQMMLLAPVTSMVVDESTLLTTFELYSMHFDVPEAIAAMGPRYVFAMLVAILFALLTIKVIADSLGNIMMSNASHAFLARLRGELFGRYLAFGKAFYDRLGVARVYAALMTQTFEISAQLPLIRSLISQTVLTVGYVYVLVSISWRLALIAVSIYPIYRVTNKIINKRINSASVRNFANLGRFTDYVNTTLSCVPLIKAFNGEKDAHRRFVGIAEDVASTEVEIERRVQTLNASHEFIVPLLAVGMLVALRFSTVLHADSGGARVLVFFLAMRRCAGSSSAVVIALSRLSRIGPMCEQLEETMAPSPAYLVPSGALELGAIRTGIELRRLRFGYDGAQVLKGVNLTIPKGKRIAVVGPTGSGKSTILSILLRLYDVEPGTVLIDGADIRGFSLTSLRDRVSVVSQDCYVLNDSLRNNLGFFARGAVTEERLWEVLTMACFDERVRRMPQGLDTAIGDRGIALSGGEKQRLSIARALLRDPELLLLDEATSALDRETESRVNLALDQFCAGRTVVAVAHRLATIAQYDWIVALHGGEIVEQGTYDELMGRENGYFRQSLHLQAMGLVIKAG